MIPISKALKIIEKQIPTLAAEPVELADSTERILAENIFADTDLPPFDRSQMDGFAVRSKDVRNAPAKLRIIGESVAGKGFDGKIKAGEAVRIMTGARVPEGADCVQKKELVRETENDSVEILETPKSGQHIVSRADEIKSGAQVFSKGALLNAQMIAVLASFGYAHVNVFQKPKVSILATGSEIVHFSDTPQRDQIRDSNSVSLRIFAEKSAARAGVLPLIADDLEQLIKTIEKAAQRSDLLILSGGVSVGDYDFTKPALRELGAEMFFERVALRPGKPTVFARLGDCFVFGLPGNPVSVAVTFFLFVRKAILQMQGAGECGLREGSALLTKNVKGAKERDSYLPGKLVFNEKAQISVEPAKWGGSSDFVAFSKADCLIKIPQDKKVEAGAVVKFVYLP